MVNRVLALTALLCSPLCYGIATLVAPKIGLILFWAILFGLPELLFEIAMIIGGVLQLTSGFNNPLANYIAA